MDPQNTNEKKGGLKVVAFDRPPFELFVLRFSKKSVRAPSYERHKTTQQNLFLSFEIQISDFSNAPALYSCLKTIFIFK
jgi:hypothetical protein